MIIDGSFELDHVKKGSEHTGIDTNKPTFKPFWEVQYLGNGLTYGGTKKECIEWIAEFYYEHYDKRSKSASETEKKALNWVNKCMRSAS